MFRSLLSINPANDEMMILSSVRNQVVLSTYQLLHKEKKIELKN